MQIPIARFGNFSIDLQGSSTKTPIASSLMSGGDSKDLEDGYTLAFTKSQKKRRRQREKKVLALANIKEVKSLPPSKNLRSKGNSRKQR